jgi:hypothetical protein
VQIVVLAQPGKDRVFEVEFGHEIYFIAEKKAIARDFNRMILEKPPRLDCILLMQKYLHIY